MTALKTAAFCEANRFTKGQAISFEILNLAAEGMNIREALETVCGVPAAELPAGATDEEVLQAVRDTFFDHITPDQIALAFS